MFGFFNKYPYTDYSQINLDWIVERIKSLESFDNVTNITTYYATGSTPTIPTDPDDWSTEIPEVLPGEYMFVKIVMTFASGKTEESYIIDRVGEDGSGTVDSVAGVAPDENGDVPKDSLISALDIDQYVDDRVEQLAEDGFFNDLIEAYVDDSVNLRTVMADIQTARQFRVVDNKGYQDMTVNGNNFIFCANITGGDIRITETDVNGHIIRYNDLNTISSCNSIAYDPGTNNLYIAQPIGVSPYNGPINVVKYSDFTKTGAITDSDYNFISCAISDGTLYAIGYYIPMDQVRIVKYENGNIIPVVNLTIPESTPFSRAWQSFEVVDDIAYCLFTTPNGVMTVNLKTGGCTFNSFEEGSGYYPYGEMEGITKKGDSVYILSTFGDAGTTFVNQVFKTNFTGTLVADSNNYGTWPYINERSTMYVDSSSTETNPTGYNEHKFSCMTEALAVWKYLDGRFFTAISCAADGNFSDEIITLTNCFVSINGGNNTFKSITFENCDGQIYNFETVEDCKLLNFRGRVNWYNGGTALTLNSVNATLSNITPTVNATHATIAELTEITYGTTSNLFRVAEAT